MEVGVNLLNLRGCKEVPLSGIQMRMDPAMMQKLPQEMIAMFQKMAELVSDIEIQPLRTYKVEVKRRFDFLGYG